MADIMLNVLKLKMLKRITMTTKSTKKMGIEKIFDSFESNLNIFFKFVQS